MSDAVGLYISVPFCRAKCTFCNFASDAFSPALLPAYVAALVREIESVRERVRGTGASPPAHAETVYFGGGTPSLLRPAEIQQIFSSLRSAFLLADDAEITIECAPGQLSDASLEAFLCAGVNRLSFGVQSFVDEEARGVGRGHTAVQCLADLNRVGAAGIDNVSVDLIAGLPGQTETSWLRSLNTVLDAGIPHASVYLLEVDEHSRLGREVIQGGVRYGARCVPNDDVCVELYELACEHFESAGLQQYEISNFARARRRSRHNLKYWTRAPYLGFGLDAHSMLRLNGPEAIRFANTDDLTAYLEPGRPISDASTALTILPTPEINPAPDRIGTGAALEETLFLGLRLNDGINLRELRACFGPAFRPFETALSAATHDGLLESVEEQVVGGERLRLTRRGRALSNDVFARLLLADDVAA